ncbi:uncharacterized protein N7498_008854 [Penicillium cinerascens]|uniref:Amino acid permease/ SLC12A domain-containing protein n=1 Tax=Penicillium cinerascens TaxID=70096 RepID=A0A9W9MA27_9EURO|nr:uncharacterized protein N7498_008854 [Penicillium cinerascens]KAJ5195416.1 hypothetical protein N7498_008854 [Penicillium cinerascens]
MPRAAVIILMIYLTGHSVAGIGIGQAGKGDNKSAFYHSQNVILPIAGFALIRVTLSTAVMTATQSVVKLVDNAPALIPRSINGLYYQS